MTGPSALPDTAKRALLDWYHAAKRDLPWRRTRDPYAILVSEVMLQQTQVATVVPYFERWMARFPSAESLAAASDDEILGIWQGLGYYRRARLLRDGAGYLAANPNLGKAASDWLNVPGVGRYTAGAVTSIAFGSAEPLVDGNVVRVYSRLTADPIWAGIEKRAWEWATANLVSERAGDWNQALMELGATTCTPRDPKCGICPLSACCKGYASGDPKRFPPPKPKTEIIQEQEIMLISHHRGLFGITQISDSRWWNGMWRFPLFPAADGVALRESSARFIGKFGYTVTRHRIQMSVYSSEPRERNPALRWVALTELESLAMPSPQRKAFQMYRKTQPRLDL